MSAVERAIDELIQQELRLASEGLQAPADRSAFGYGHLCGLFQGLRMARSILERCVQERDPKSPDRR